MMTRLAEHEIVIGDVQELLIVAIDVSGDVIGTISIFTDSNFRDASQGALVRLHVRPNCRRKGMGTLLVRSAEAAARTKGLTSLSLIDESGVSDHGFWRPLGFVTTAEARVADANGMAEPNTMFKLLQVAA